MYWDVLNYHIFSLLLLSNCVHVIAMGALLLI